MRWLEYDPDAATRHLIAADPVLAAVIERAGPFDVSRSGPADPFRALLRAIVYQQLSGRAAGTILGRVEALFDGAPNAEAALHIAPETYRAAGLSTAKTRAVLDLAARRLDGTVPSRRTLKGLDDAAVIERLTAVRGVGPWTVQMLLMFNLGRPDVLPTDDLGIRKGFMLAYNKRKLPSPDAVLRHGRRWAPYRTVASWYLWRAVDLAAED